MLNQPDWNLTIAIALAAYFLSAYFFGRMEKFTFGDCQLHVGPPNFLKYFVRGYHLPIALMFIIFALALDILIVIQFEVLFAVILFFPTWCWIEDMSYFVNNPYDHLYASDWITGGLGGVTIAGQFIPFVYVGAFLYTALIVWWRIV